MGFWKKLFGIKDRAEDIPYHELYNPVSYTLKVVQIRPEGEVVELIKIKRADDIFSNIDPDLPMTLSVGNDIGFFTHTRVSITGAVMVREKLQMDTIRIMLENDIILILPVVSVGKRDIIQIDIYSKD